MTINIELAKRMAIKRAGDIRVIGELAPYDVTLLENRITGERRRVPNKHFMMVGKNAKVAFELAPMDPTFSEEQPVDDDE
jgi:hypothetical protein